MKKYSIIFNVFKSSYFYQCAVNVSPSKCKEKGSIFTIPIFTIWNSYGPSEPEVILVRTHTSLRLFTALGFFRTKWLRAPKSWAWINKNLYVHVLHPNWSLSNSKIMLGLSLASFRVRHFEGLWTQISKIKGRNT